MPMAVSGKGNMGYRSRIVLTQSSSVFQARFQHPSIPAFQHSVILWDDCDTQSYIATMYGWSGA